ncbi:hypothetical protein [Flagellimonas sp.]|uniref:hypothetical protein n=1 Tax=Flagellimonas sp. TaxID=2058762 RepID=UPI003F49C211
MSDHSTRTIQDIIYDIQKKKNEYLFGYDFDDENFHHVTPDCVECIKSDTKECPFIYKDDSYGPIKNPMRFVQCYMKYDSGFLNYLKKNDFVVAAPLFRVQTIENEDISYKDSYWYPFRSESAYLNITPNTASIREIFNLSQDDAFNKLRWDITRQRDGAETSDEISFSIFKKVESTKYSEDRRLKYIDVSDAYASFMMIYFIIAKRNNELVRWKQADYENELLWEFSDLNAPLRKYIEKKPNNILNLSIVKDKVYRKSSWIQDLQLLGFIDANHKETNKFDLFKKWLNLDLGENNRILRYKHILKQYLILPSKGQKFLTISSGSNHYIKFSEKEQRDFVLHPPIHLIVRAFWKTPVRWLFIPMTPKANKQKIISVSGLILMIKDEENEDSYLTKDSNDEILQKVKNLLPILISIYAIEKQSLEDSINRKRLELFAQQKKTSFHNAIAKVFLRTLSHNIGSHVVSRMINNEDLDFNNFLVYNGNLERASETEPYRGLTKFEQILEDTIYEKINVLSDENELEKEDIKNTLYRKYLGIFNSYIKTRMEFLADIVTGVPQLQLTKLFVDEVIKPFDQNRVLLNRISGLDKEFKFHFNVELPKGIEDVVLSISNDLLGQHAFYIILENIIRNTAKHSPKGKVSQVTFTIKIEESTLDESYYKIIVFDNVERANPFGILPMQYKQEGTSDKMSTWYKTCPRRDGDGPLVIPEIQNIALQLNDLIDSDILDETNFELRETGMGMIEMLVCAAYLRRINARDVQNDNYRLIFDHDKMETYKNQVKNKENVPKIFRAVPYDNRFLGFQFYVPKPKDILFIDKKREFIGDIDQKVSTNRGIYFITDMESRYSGSYNLCVVNDDSLAPYENKLKLPVRKILWSDINFYFNEANGINLHPNHDNFSLEAWRVYVSKFFMNKKLSSTSEELISSESKFQLYGYHFFDHGKEYKGANLQVYEEIYGSQHKRIIDRISNNGDFRDDDSLESEILYLKFLNSTINNVLILDERIQKQSKTKLSLYGKDNFEHITYHQFWNNVNVYIPDATKDFDLSKKNYSDDYTKKIIALIKSQFIDHELRASKGIDFIVVHLGVLEKILMSEKHIFKKSKESILRKVNEIKDEFKNVKIVVTSGRGQPSNLPDNIPFVSYSMLSQYLIENRFKLYLSELLYASKPLSYSDEK